MTLAAALIDAICERWMQSYQTLFTRFLPEAPTSEQTIRAHVGATFLDDGPAQTKAASLMTGMLQSPEFLVATRQWYLTQTADLDPSTPEGRSARLEFLATEGAFCLRFLGLMDFDAAEWASIHDDIDALILRDSPRKD